MSPYERRNPHEPNPSELADHLSGRRSHLVLADTDRTQTGLLAHLRGFRRNRAWLHSSPDADRRHCLHLTHLLLLYGAFEDKSGPDWLWQRHHLTHRLRVLPLARLHQNRIRPPHCLCDHQADWAFFAHARLLHCTI